MVLITLCIALLSLFEPLEADLTHAALLFKRGDIADAFLEFQKNETPQTIEEKAAYAKTAFFLRRYDIAIPLFESISLEERVKRELEPFLLECYFRVGQGEKALTEVKELMKAPLKERVALAAVFAYFGKIVPVENLLKDSVSLALPAVVVDYVRVLIYTFQYDKAESMIKANMPIFESTAEGLLAYAEFLLRQSKIAEAIAAAEKAQTLQPENPRVALFLDEKEDRLSLLQEKTALLKEREGNGSNMTLKLSYLRMLVGIALLEIRAEGSFKETLEEADRVLNGMKDLKEIPEYLLLKGVVLWYQGSHQAGKSSVVKALILDPSYGLASQILAAFYRFLKDLPAAKKALEEGKNYNLQSPAYFAQLSRIFFDLGEKTKALESIDYAIKVNLNNAEFLALRGKILYHMGELDQARSSIQKALSIDPQEPLATEIQKKLESEAVKP